MDINLNHLSESPTDDVQTTPTGITPTYSAQTRMGMAYAPRLGRKRELHEQPKDPQVWRALEASFKYEDGRQGTPGYVPAYPAGEFTDADVAQETQGQLEAAGGGAMGAGESDADLPAPSVSTVELTDELAPPVDPETIAIDQVEIPDILLAEQSYLMGAAGTGKTFMSRAWVRQYPGTVLAATTGIAAVNLGEGTTINSLLGYFDTDSLREMYTSGHLQARLGKLWRAGVRRILIDEVSMMDGEQLTILTRACGELAGKGMLVDADLAEEMAAWKAQEKKDPICLTLVGDFAQLPPVRASFAFESPLWDLYGRNTHRLTHIWRQEDREFIEALQAARRGDGDHVVRYFGPRLARAMDDQFDGSTIFAKNDAVARYNQLRMDRLTTPLRAFTASRWGDQRTDWKAIPDVLHLKEGALVMLLANERHLPTATGMPGKIIYANGDLATVVAMNEQAGVVTVELKRNGARETVQWVQRENLIPLAPGRAKELRLAGEEHLIKERFEVIGTITYLPIRLAYATTVHKSQGLTLDQVQVNTNEGMFKTPGLLYVALSRARSADGLRIIGSPQGLKSRASVHGKVKAYL